MTLCVQVAKQVQYARPIAAPMFSSSVLKTSKSLVSATCMKTHRRVDGPLDGSACRHPSSRSSSTGPPKICKFVEARHFQRTRFREQVRKSYDDIIPIASKNLISVKMHEISPQSRRSQTRPWMAALAGILHRAHRLPSRPTRVGAIVEAQ